MEVENNLRAEQEFVGGRIATYPVTDELILIHNDDGINDGLKPRAVVLGEGEGNAIDLRGIREIIHGDCFVCRFDGIESFTSIEDDDIKIIGHYVKPVMSVTGSVLEIGK